MNINDSTVGEAPPPSRILKKKLRGLAKEMMRTTQFKVNRQTTKIFLCKMCIISILVVNSIKIKKFLPKLAL